MGIFFSLLSSAVSTVTRKKMSRSGRYSTKNDPSVKRVEKKAMGESHTVWPFLGCFHARNSCLGGRREGWK